MTLQPHRLARPLRLLMIAAILSAAPLTSGCNTDNPSSLAGTIDAPKRVRPKFEPKKSGPPKLVKTKSHD